MDPKPAPAAGEREWGAALQACMSERHVPWSEFASLRAEVAELRSLCQALSARLIVLEQPRLGSAPSSEFELVTEAPSTESTSAATAVGADLPADRVRAAEKIGAWIKRCLQNEHRGLSGREEIPLATKLYIVVRDIRGTLYNPPRVCNSWAETKLLCCLDKQFGDNIFVGLPTKAEARIAVCSADLEVPAELSRRR